MKNRFTGLFAAVHTPMKYDRSVDLERIPRIVEHLGREQIGGAFVCGSTGEWPSLTGEERRNVAATYVKACGKETPVIVNVGHTSLPEARALAIHARDLGAAAIAAVPPFYFKPDAPAVLADTLAEVASAVPDLPFFFYPHEGFTGISLPIAEVILHSVERIPNFAGVKYSATDIEAFRAGLQAADEKVDLLFGMDNLLFPALEAGAKGAVGAGFNFAAPLFRKMWKSFHEGRIEEARTCHGHAVELVNVLSRYRIMSALKAVMNLIGLDCGPTRLPLVPLSPTELKQMNQDLRTIGFYEWGRSP